MTATSKSDRDGASYVRLSRQDYYKLAGLGLVFFALVMSGTVALSGILAHMDDDQRHQTPMEKAEQIEMIMDRRDESMRLWITALFNAHVKVPHNDVGERLDNHEKRIYSMERSGRWQGP